jgi:phosphoglycolate phosphatase-like HAD superfamily hydrolase
MTQLHVVWDWNGTLLDDLEIVIEAANVCLAEFGVEPLDENRYRDHFRRPVRAFYDSLFDRPVTDEEWHRLNNVFHVEYMARADAAELTVDALDALDAVGSNPVGQSLLSMSPQDWLEGIVRRKGVIERFSLVSGLSGETGGLKAAHMAEHIHELGLDPRRTVVIGDTPDDAQAARHVGAHVVLYDGGSHHLPVLQQTDAPVAHSLMDAIEIAGRL